MVEPEKPSERMKVRGPSQGGTACGALGPWREVETRPDIEGLAAFLKTVTQASGFTAPAKTVCIFSGFAPTGFLVCVAAGAFWSKGPNACI